MTKTVKTKKPQKTELARFKALNDLGFTPNAIGKKTGRDPKTVRMHLLDSEVFNDPDIQGMVERIKGKELDDLTLLGAKARKRLHELLDNGDTKAIETCAVMDRSFQQRRLLEGQATQIVDFQATTKRLKDIEAEIAVLEAGFSEGEA